MAERAKDQKKTEGDKLDVLIQKHEELNPNVTKTAVMVDLYCLSSTREIAPCSIIY